MTITTSGGLIPNPLVPGGYLLVGDATMTGTGTTSVAVSALGSLTVSGAGTDIEFSNLNATAAATTLNVTGGAHATVDSLTGISVLSTFNIGNGSRLTLAAGLNVGALPTIDFALGSGVLELANGAVNLNVGEQITNFGPSSSILFDGQTFTGGSYTNGALTLTGAGGATMVVPLASDATFAGEYFHLVGTGTGTSLILNSVAAGGIPACYLQGTRIRTDRGEVPVEYLAIGDTVITVSGQSRRIKWIGTRSYMRRFAAANAGVQPVRIRAGALGRSQPVRDLLVSQAHAMFLEGVLIPAEALVNGSSITIERSNDDIHYYHVELDTHDVIWAEGAPSETYVDEDNRAVFHNAQTFVERFPHAAPGNAEHYAPRLQSGYAVEAARRAIAGQGSRMRESGTLAIAA